MIRPININLNAAHPELPLVEATTFTGAPSSVFIRGVPKAVGNWSITAVSVAVTYPDNTTTARAAVESAEGVWVATIPGTATSGRTAAGFRILADGIDENGAAVTGYVLGFADFAVLSFFPVPAPGETFFYLRYFDTMPTAAKKMDVTTIDGILKYYNGTAWQPFTDLSDYYTAEQVDEAIDKLAAYYITADAQGNPFATHSALVNAQTYYSGGAVRTPTRNDYAVVSADETHGGAEWRYIYAVDAQGVGQWEPQYAVEGVIAYDNTVTPTSANGVKSSGIWSALWGTASTAFSSLYDWCVAQLAGKASTADATLTPIYSQTPTFSSWQFSTTGGLPIVEPSVGYSSGTWTFYEIGEAVATCEGDWDAVSLEFSLYPYVVTATRTRTDIIGYVLGSQSTKPLASEAEAEALRTGKQDALSAQQLANIAAVSDAPAFDATHSYSAGDPVVYNGTLYTFTATHTGAWTGSDVSAVDMIARLAGKANDADVVHKTGAETIAGRKTFTSGIIVSSGGSRVMYDQGGIYVEGGATINFPGISGTMALNTDLPYALVTKTINNGAVSLDDRASNSVAVSSALASLTINFPTATSGKVRDFGLRLTVASGITTAPELALPQGVVCENADGEAPEIGADGAATILYFTETASGVFLVKGEVVTAIS